VHMVETINKLIRTQRRLVQELGREPLPEEIAAEMEMDVDKVNHIMKIKQETVSLEAPVGEEEDSQLGDFIADDDAKDAVGGRDRSAVEGACQPGVGVAGPRASRKFCACASVWKTAASTRWRKSARSSA